MDRIGRYKIVRELGRGAMGVVYHAIDPNIGRPVAIKTIHFSGRDKEEQDRLRERLFREARSAGILSHPGIVTIYDVEQQGEVAYIAMEYVDGPTLDQVMSQSHALPAEQMFSILGQTAAALDYAHQKGIVHRDIKPANIMIAADGTAKITDFGIAKITTSESLTLTGNIVGTPHYMSPEQVQGQPVDGRSDQFSLAVIAFEMLTGEKPYTGEHLTTVVYKIVAEEPLAPHRLNPSLSGAIEGAVKKAMSKKPDGRYATCQDFANALEKACAATKGWKTMPRGASLSEPTVSDSARPAVAMPPPRRTRRGDATTTVERGERRSTGFLTFLLAILVAAGLLALIGWQAIPWFGSNPPGTNTPANTTASNAGQTAPAQAPVARAPASAPASAPAAAAPPPAAAAEPTRTQADAKPAPIPPPAERPQRAEEPVADENAKPSPMRRAAPSHPAVIAEAPAPTPQPVSIISSPGGAVAELDGRADTACTTPCSLDAEPGRHTIAVTLPGYQIEHREVDVGTVPPAMPAIVLHALGGTLMLTSVPSGAAVLVDGRRVSQTTPMQLQLPPGSYRITVEKNGQQRSQEVVIRGGITYLKIPLGQ